MVKNRKYCLHDGISGSALTIRITPRMAKNEIYGILDDGTVKIRLTAPPVEGKANKELIKFLSQILDVPVSSIEIIAGQTGHDKIVSVLNLDSEQVQQKILENIAK